MEYKLLEKQDVELMKYFVDDDNTKYDEVILNTFLEEKNTFGYIAKENDIIVGFAFGYVLVKPNGIKIFICMPLIYWKNIRIMAMERNW